MRGNYLSRKTAKKGFKKGSLIFLVVMLAVPVLNWIVFWLAVNFTSFAIAFQDTAGNFSFVNFSLFWDSLTGEGGELAVAALNTLKYFGVSILVVFPLTLIVCYFLYKKIFCYKLFRIVFFLPAVISAVVFTGVFKTVIANQGPLGIIAKALNIQFPQHGLLGTPDTATNTIMVYTVWTGICANMLIISGAMARIPPEVLESAKLDGIGVAREFVSIILPLIWPTLSTIIVLSMTGLLLSSGPILLLQPDTSLGTSTISYWIFEKVWANGSMGAGQYSLVSAAGLCFTLVLVPITLLARFLMNKIPSVEY